MPQGPVRFFINSMSKIILFIDGENFFHKVEEIIDKEFKGKGLPKAIDIDLKRLFEKPLGNISVSQKIFYAAKLHYHPDTPKKSQELIKVQRKLINNLKRQGFEFIMSGNVRGQKVNGKVIFREKGVDVKIAVDLVSFACDGKLKTAILCSSDSDLQPAISELRKRKVEIIYLGFETSPNKGLVYTCNRTILLRNSEVMEALRK